MVRKIYQELILIKKELQATRSSMESKSQMNVNGITKCLNTEEYKKYTRKATR